MQRSAFVDRLDEELRTDAYADIDASPNGLQVGSREGEVETVAVGGRVPRVEPVETASDDAGVVQGVAVVLPAEVEVGVERDQHVRVGGAHARPGDGVFAAEQERNGVVDDGRAELGGQVIEVVVDGVPRGDVARVVDV